MMFYFGIINSGKESKFLEKNECERRYVIVERQAGSLGVESPGSFPQDEHHACE